MNISNNCINIIKKYEGCRLEAYLCPANIPTIGYGTTTYPDNTKVKIGDKCTQAEADEYLIDHINNILLLLNNIKEVRKNIEKLNQNQLDAIVSFIYNLGLTNFTNSTLYRKIALNPNDTTIEAEFMKWVNAGGKSLVGLVNRRREESQLYKKII